MSGWSDSEALVVRAVVDWLELGGALGMVVDLDLLRFFFFLFLPFEVGFGCRSLDEVLMVRVV